MRVRSISVIIIVVVTVGLALVLGNALLTSAQELIASSTESGMAFEITSPRQGSFTSPGMSVTFELPVLNSGFAPTDTFELLAESNWPTRLLGPGGTTPLTDTNGNGTVDTGSVPIGDDFTIKVQVDTPSQAALGDSSITVLTVTSVMSPSDSNVATLQSAVPAPFAQVLRDGDFTDGAVSVILAHEGGQSMKTIDREGLIEIEPAIADSPTGLVLVWNKYQHTGNVWSRKIEYTLLDKYGGTVRPVDSLTNYFGDSTETYDTLTAVAVTPQGDIGIFWHKEIFDETGKSLENLYLAILDAAGETTFGPVNVTGSTVYTTADVFRAPRIAATDDGRFVLAWQRSTDANNADIYYTVRGNNGVVIRDVTNLTANQSASTYHIEPALIAISSDRAFISWNSRIVNGDSIAYTVLDSDGNVVKQIADLSQSEGFIDWGNYDAAELSDGRIVAVWKAFKTEDLKLIRRIGFAVLDENYERVGEPAALAFADPTLGGDAYASASADGDGNAVITWTSWDQLQQSQLYYALVNGLGEIVSPPMIFYTAQGEQPSLVTSYEGYGNASHLFLDAQASFYPARIEIPPGQGQTLSLSLTISNSGTISASELELGAAFGGDLTYIGDTSEITPAVNLGNKVVIWDWPDLAALQQSTFILNAGLPTESITASHTVTVTVVASGQDVDLENNTATAEVIVRAPVYLPVVHKTEDE